MPKAAPMVTLNHPLWLHAMVMVDRLMFHVAGHRGFWLGRKAIAGWTTMERERARKVTREVAAI